MTTKIAACLLTAALFGACTTTSTTTAQKRETLREMQARYAAAPNDANSLNEPPPPAEGPEDIPAEGPQDVLRNPALVPSPLLRNNAAGGL